jgi:TonB family protein
MRELSVIAFFVGLATSISGGQQNSPSAPPSAANDQQARVKVYAVGPGVTAPELLPLNLAPIPAEKCKKNANGIVILSIIVDAAGQPRNLTFFHPVGTDLDKLALQIAAADRFKPGTSDGAPVAVAQLLDVIMQTCIEQKKDDAGKKTSLLRLRSQPVQKLANPSKPPEEAVFSPVDSNWKDSGSTNVPSFRVGSGVSAPVPLNNVEAAFTDAARRANYQGSCQLSMIVDAHGMPQNVRIVKPLDYGLSEKAIEAVSKYRFKPAMKDGQPVPVTVNVEVNFWLYK